MHRSYQSVLPCQNKILKKRWDERYYEEHRQKVAEAKSQVDTKPPKTHMHLHLKLKKLQLEEERLATIERDNRILLEKMSTIMRTRGRIDNKNDYEYKSLNREKRMRELLRVTQENQDILKRIIKKKSEFCRESWEADWQKNQEFMDSIACYPREWWLMPRGASTKPGSRMTKENPQDQSQQNRSSGRKKQQAKEKKASSSGRNSRKQSSAGEATREETPQDTKEEEGNDEEIGVKG